MAKQCWDYLKCDGARKENCPAFSKNMGQECWKVTGTLCKGKTQGSMAEKIAECRKCGFYQDVNKIKLSIKNKLMLGFASVLILLVIVGLLGFFQLVKINSSYSELLNHDILIATETQNMLIDYETAALDLRAYLMTGGKDYLNRFEEGLEKAKSNLDLIESHIKDPEAKNKQTSIKNALTDFENYADQAINLKEQNKSQELNLFIGANRGYISAVINASKQLVELEKSFADRSALENSRGANFSKNFILSLVIIALLLGIGISLYMAALIANPLKRMELAASRIASGDLTVDEIKINNSDELGSLARAFNEMTVSLKDIVGHLAEKAAVVYASASQLTTNCQQTAATANETASSANQIASAVEQVNQDSQLVLTSSDVAASFAQKGEVAINEVTAQILSIADSTSNVGQAINDLSIKSQEINKIVELITQIADQTNLLALNAAIEAARAGEQGRGFAVVAEEVRKLAEQSAGAAKEIYKLINDIGQVAERAVQTMETGAREVKVGTEKVREVESSFKEILVNVRGVNEQLHGFASAAQQMSAGVQNVAASAEEQSSAMEEVTASIETLTNLSTDLQALSQRFKI